MNYSKIVKEGDRYITPDRRYFADETKAKEHTLQQSIWEIYTFNELEVKDYHLALMKHASLKITEAGDWINGIFQDGKRPYGNSAWESDVAEITDLQEIEYNPEHPEYTREQLDFINRIHYEAALCWTILQDNNLTIQPGLYRRDSFGYPWKLQTADIA